jgi:hypothetical protein
MSFEEPITYGYNYEALATDTGPMIGSCDNLVIAGSVALGILSLIKFSKAGPIFSLLPFAYAGISAYQKYIAKTCPE